MNDKESAITDPIKYLWNKISNLQDMIDKYEKEQSEIEETLCKLVEMKKGS